MAEHLNDPRRSIERGKYIVGRYRELVRRFPDEEWRVAVSMSLHSRILEMHDHRPEALRWNQEAIERYQSHPAKDVDATVRHVECLINQSCLWDYSGHLERALGFILQAVVVGEPYSFDSPSVASDTVSAMYCSGYFMCGPGRYGEAVAASLEAIDFARRVTLTNVADLVGSLQLAAMSHKLCWKQETRKGHRVREGGNRNMPK